MTKNIDNEYTCAMLRINGKIVTFPHALKKDIEARFGRNSLAHIVRALAHNFEQLLTPPVSLTRYVNAHLTQSVADESVGAALEKAGKRLLKERRERTKRVWEAFRATPANEPFDPALIA